MNRWKDSRIIKTKRPKFKHCFGRTWDYITILLPEGKKVDGAFDTTWGRWAYFYDKVTNNCYKVSMDCCSNRLGLKIDLSKEELK